eukprot:TRINITY_DN6257_c0_g1_i2.p1 TRINITY_DN6257_c0_g1~~TRINITY_DN6257_c0_g1_i2.p1  ORF type:complete len:558 (-),score=138.88 TRINITY_DN6257_c0_g1_i2:12-1685(-)
MPSMASQMASPLSSPSVSLSEIEMDILRTFPNHPFLLVQENRDKLKRVLGAFSLRNPSVGYCQSMNNLCFFFFLVLGAEEEEKVFWCLVLLVEEWFPDYYSKNMVGSQVDQRVFHELMEDTFPLLASRLQAIGVLISAITIEWFLCLFTTTFVASTALIVWDNIFFHGAHVVLEVGLAVLYLHRDALEQGTCISEVANTLDERNILIDPTQLLKTAVFTVGKISKQRLSALRMKHWRAITQEVEDLHEKRELRHLSSRTRIGLEKLQELKNEFKILSLDGSGITFLQFQQVFGRVMPNWAGDASDGNLSANNLATVQLLANIFEVFDENCDKMLSFAELVMGLSILYQGNLDEKLRLIFRAFDQGNKGFLSREEVKRMFYHVYDTFYRPIVQPSQAEDVYNDHLRRQLAAFVDAGFETNAHDKTLEGQLSLDGLRRLVIIQPLILECFQPAPADLSPASPELKGAVRPPELPPTSLKTPVRAPSTDPIKRKHSFHLLENPGASSPFSASPVVRPRSHPVTPGTHSPMPRHTLGDTTRDTLTGREDRHEEGRPACTIM